jgi:PASTA domain
MNRRLIRIALVAGLSSTFAGAFAATAGADTAVMGSPLVSNYDGGVSTGTNVTVQLSFDPATSPNPVVSPANGVITDWKVKSADDGAVYTLKVLRPNGPVSLVTATSTNFSAIASVAAPSAVPNGTFAATPTGVIFDYPASLPISKGDYLGVLSVGGPGLHGLPQAMANGLPQSMFANRFGGQPADGTSADLLADAQHELLLQATIKFCKVPNVVGQTEAAATAAITAGDCTATVSKQSLQLRAIRKGFSKKKKANVRAANAALRAQDGKVISQSIPADTTSAPRSAVELKVGQVVPPPKKKKKAKKH